ncbi:hypothetical protein CaCOL14_001145 [Colletotrichum acutatum]
MPNQRLLHELCDVDGPIAEQPQTHAPKRTVVPQWQCCACGHGAMPIRLAACQYCGTYRCAYCPVSRVRTRSAES